METFGMKLNQKELKLMDKLMNSDIYKLAEYTFRTTEICLETSVEYITLYSKRSGIVVTPKMQYVIARILLNKRYCEQEKCA